MDFARSKKEIFTEKLFMSFSYLIESFKECETLCVFNNYFSFLRSGLFCSPSAADAGYEKYSKNSDDKPSASAVVVTAKNIVKAIHNCSSKRFSSVLSLPYHLMKAQSLCYLFS